MMHGTVPVRPSIADVAARAGVSATTVSHALSGRRPVSDGAVAAVRRAVVDLGYVPHHSARSLRRGRTQMIGLLVPDVGNPYFAQLARGMDEVAQRSAYALVIGSTEFDAGRESRFLEVLAEGSIDGLAYASGARPPVADLAAFAADRPLVAVDAVVHGLDAATIVSDHRRGGRLVGEHLRQLGHRHVLLVNGPPDVASSRDRRAGFLAAFADGELELHEAAGDYRGPSGAVAVRGALARGRRRFTAVFAANDAMAAGALQALHHAGLAVPREVSVAGFDDAPLAALLHPGLTTVRQHGAELGRAAARRLLAALDAGAGSATDHTVLDVDLVVRDSTATNQETAQWP
jgi:LacI family transcriptional regulator